MRSPARLPRTLALVRDQIEVEGAGPPANGSLPTPAPLDLEQPRKDVERRERCVDHRHRIEEPALLRPPHGLGLVDPADGDDRTERLESGQTGSKVIETITQVGAEGDRHSGHVRRVLG